MGITNRKFRIGVVAVVVIALFLSIFPSNIYGLTLIETANTRIYGNSKYDTAFAIADELYKKNGPFDAVVVAYGEDYPDALSGGYLAKEKNAPILLVNINNESENKVLQYTKTHMKTNGMVYILGGNSVVRPEFEDKLEAAGLEYKRLGGATRLDTNLLILKETNTYNSEILICTAKDFTDTVSASAVGAPIMIVANELNKEQLNFLKEQRPEQIFIIGGENAVSSTVYTQASRISPTERIGGTTRYDTSVLVARRFFPMNQKSIVLTTALNFPDGLAGAPLAMEAGAPIITVSDATSPGVAAEYARERKVTRCYTLGGPLALSDKTVNLVLERYVDYVSGEPAGKIGTAQDVLNVMRSWLGYNETNGKFKEIIDIYNKVYPLPVGYTMKYYDEWCDACVSAAAIVAGCADIIGRECGVERHVKIFKEKGIWIEDGTIAPRPGYVVVFNWDIRTQPNNGPGHHIGFVESVVITGYDANGNPKGTITTIEGNYSEAVKRRTIPIGYGYIRGFAAPNYRTTSVYAEPTE